MRTETSRSEVLFGVVFTPHRLRLLQVALLHELIDANEATKREIQEWLQELDDLEGRACGG